MSKRSVNKTKKIRKFYEGMRQVNQRHKRKSRRMQGSKRRPRIL